VHDIDNSIYMNQKTLRDYEQKIMKIGEEIASFQFDNSCLEKKCLALEERIKTLSRRYDNLVLESNKLCSSPKIVGAGDLSDTSVNSKAARRYTVNSQKDNERKYDSEERMQN
jgi:hypothetical protein